MTALDAKFFQPMTYSSEDLANIFNNACRDLHIAKEDSFSEVRFTYSYQALLKSGIALIAKTQSAKVRSMPGHHIKILELMAEILDDEQVLVTGNAMRMKRNADLYSVAQAVTEKEAQDCCQFVAQVVARVEEIVTEAG